MGHTHKQEMEFWTYVCTSFHLCQLFTDHWRVKTSFLSFEIIIYFIFLHLISFLLILFNSIQFDLIWFFYFILYYLILLYFFSNFFYIILFYFFLFWVCTSFHFCQLYTDHQRGRTSFLISEIINLFHFVLFFIFIFFYSIFFSFIFLLLYLLVDFLLNHSIINLSSFFIMNCGIHTNRKWNYKYVSFHFCQLFTDH